MVSVNRPRAIGLVLAAGALGGCGALLGVADYEPVDCVGACDGSGDAATDALGADALASDALAANDALGKVDGDACGALAPCASGHRIAVKLGQNGAGDGGAVRIVSSPGGIDVREGELGSACFPAVRIDLDVSSGSATFQGAPCEDPTSTTRCRFDVREPLCIVATPR